MLYDNTTIKGSWMNLGPEQNMSTLSGSYKRIVNNVTMAMPHPGVLQAAGDRINNILQPRDLSVCSTTLLCRHQTWKALGDTGLTGDRDLANIISMLQYPHQASTFFVPTYRSTT